MKSCLAPFLFLLALLLGPAPDHRSNFYRAVRP